MTRGQLLELGISPRTIGYRLTSHRLIAVHTGVYGVGHAQRTPLARAHAAVLACGPGAALSHDSAGALWGWRRWPDLPEVSAPVKHRRPGIVTHRSRTLTRHDVTINHGIPVTAVVRTLIDMNPRLNDREFTRAVNDARLASQLKRTALDELLRRCPRAERLIDPRQSATRSPAENEFLAWIRRHRLPTPQINVRRGGHEVDAIFVAEKVIVELDGWTFHKDYASFRTDRARDRRNAARGYLTLRFTPDDLTAEEAQRLRQILIDRRPR